MGEGSDAWTLMVLGGVEGMTLIKTKSVRLDINTPFLFFDAMAAATQRGNAIHQAQDRSAATPRGHPAPHLLFLAL